jgi:ribonuclease P/MRP protein subunit RPP40
MSHGGLKKLEKVQMRATKLVQGIRKLSYQDRLKSINLPTLKYRRIRGDIIEVFKMISGKYDPKVAINFDYGNHTVICTRGNRLRMFQRHRPMHYNLRKYFFSIRIISIWNSLPDYINSPR